MSDQDHWLPGLVELVRRRPDLEGIGYAPLVREGFVMSAAAESGLRDHQLFMSVMRIVGQADAPDDLAAAIHMAFTPATTPVPDHECAYDTPGAGPCATCLADAETAEMNFIEAETLRRIERARAEGKAEGLREAADDIVTDWAPVWGGPGMWFTTGNAVAELVADTLRSMASEIEP